jgi:pimeloyl-ACP methyl ester carboxylesterase
MDLQFTVFLGLVAAALIASWFLLPTVWARLLLVSGRRVAGMRSRVITADGVRWHYLEGGTGPALVAVHGFGADADHWLQLGHVLKRHFRFIAPDLPGFGTSEAGAHLSYDIASQAARLAGFLDEIGVRTCVLAGSSMGGWISTQFAAAHPDRVRALWLMAPLGVRDCRTSPILKAIESGRDSPVRLESQADFERNVLRPMFFRPPWIPYPLRRFYGRRAVARCAAAAAMFRQVRGESEPLEELATRVTAPVLLQWGEDDQAVDVGGTQALARAFDDIEVSTHARTGHLPMLEIPGESLRLFRNFARRKLDRQAPETPQNHNRAGL